MARWYILHTASGSEKSVKRMIEDQIAKKNMSDSFEEIIVPTIDIPEVKRGKKVISEKKYMPGYILIKMQMTDEAWHLVKSVPKITGFLGSKNKPQALSQKEAERMFNNLAAESEIATSSTIYNAGDEVEVIDGPFESFSGTVKKVDLTSQKLSVSVSIFGKDTPMELNFNQVKKK